MMTRKVFIFLFVLLSYIPLLAQVDTAWVRRFDVNGAEEYVYALTVDSSGNVYVTGYGYIRATGFDFTTLKYSPLGDILWASNYNGIFNGDDRAYALVVDLLGNVFVTGGSPGVGIDDYATVKYSPNGDTLWIRHYDGSANGHDRGRALTVDDSGNVYITGFSQGSGSSYDYATIKYSREGDSLWVNRYDGPANSDDQVSALTVDKSGNVYVTGSSMNGGFYDFATIKYDSNGDIVWVRRYNGPGNKNDLASALAVDISGNVYVTGGSQDTSTDPYKDNYDYATIKYAPNGDTLWVRRYSETGNSEDRASDLTVDQTGNVYVTGFSQGSGTYADYATIKYAPNGDILWVRRYNGSADYHDQAIALAVDESGDVYVTGFSTTTFTFPYRNYDITTIKYSSIGNTLWVSVYDAIGGEDAPKDLVLDDKGNVYVTGFSEGSGTQSDYVTIKYIQFACVTRAGDSNGDDTVNLQDIIFNVNYVFKGGPPPSPLCRGDDNADGKVNLTDIIYEVNYVFKGGPAPLKSRECCL